MIQSLRVREVRALAIRVLLYPAVLGYGLAVTHISI